MDSEEYSDFTGITILGEHSYDPVKNDLGEFAALAITKGSKRNLNFFLGNGIYEEDVNKAADLFIQRDYEKLHKFEKDGDLGAIFVPPMFFSQIPEMPIKLPEGKEFPEELELPEVLLDQQRGDDVEEYIYDELKEIFTNSTDDVIVIHSHKLLDVETNKHEEKDFIILNYTKGYVMVIEAKSSANALKKANKQLESAKKVFKKIFTKLGIQSKWILCCVIIAQHDPFKKVPESSRFHIILDNENETIESKLKKIEEVIQTSQDTDVDTIQKLSDFHRISKYVLCIAQGDANAPITSKF